MLPSLINANRPNALCQSQAVACGLPHDDHLQPSTLSSIHRVQASPLCLLSSPVPSPDKEASQMPQSKPRPGRPGMPSCARTRAWMPPCLIAARVPLLPFRRTSDHLSPLYSLDTIASPQSPCTCLETTPPAAMAADALHGHAMIPIAPVLQMTCQDHQQNPLARLLRLAIITLPLHPLEHHPDAHCP